MKFICPTHGEVKPTNFIYSCPIMAKCPICKTEIVEANGKCPDEGDEV